jgi:hypothetical protein
MTIGKLAYKYFFKPTLPMRYNLKHFGLMGCLAYRKGEAEMKSAALNLPPIDLQLQGDTLPISFLTGRNYWHQTIFCIQSLTKQCGVNFSIKLYSDGSIDKQTEQYFKAFCPKISIIAEDQLLDSLNTFIPQNKYPLLHFIRNWSPFFRRMIDIHCKPEWNIHLDSDMIFTGYPTDLINYAKNKSAFYMEERDDKCFFSDSSGILLSKHNIKTIERVNGGVIAYDGNVIDYDALEHVTKILLDNYFEIGPGPMEQTLMSHILSTQSGKPLNPEVYKILYYDEQITTGREALKHFIFKAKLPYFSREWKKIPV